MKKKTAIGLLTVILILCACNILYWATQKEGLHCDEVYSFGLSNFEEEYFYKTADESGKIIWNTDAEIDRYMAADTEHRFEYDRVIYNQKMDVHPPLHYLILHTVSSVFPGSTSFFLGIIPNLIFTLGTCVLLYFIAMQVLQSRTRALLCVLLFAFSINCINMATYIRMYAEVTFFATAIFYLHLRYANDGYTLKAKMAVLISLTVFLGAYTHYYFLIFLFATAAFTVGAMATKRLYKKILPYIGLMAASGILYLLLWPTALMHVFQSGRGQEAFSNVTGASFFVSFVRYLGRIALSLGIATTALIVIALVLHSISPCKRCKKCGAAAAESRHSFFAFFVTVVYTLLIVKVSPYQEDRYIAMAFPLLSMLCVCLLFSAAGRVQQIWPAFGHKKQAWVILALLVFCLVSSIRMELGGIGVENIEEGLQTNRNHMNYLYRQPEETVRCHEKYKNTRCISVYSHEAQFLFNLQDYKNFKATAFVKAPEIIDLSPETFKDEKQVLVYVNTSIPVDPFFEVLCEHLGYDSFKYLYSSYQRNWANVFLMTRK